MHNKLIGNIEEVVGAVTGSIVGVISHRTFSDIAITMSLSIVTGFLGGLGAWLFKLLIAKFKRKHNG